MCECTLLCGSRCPIFTLHHAIVGGWAAERDPVALIIRAHACERAAPRYQAFKVINMRRLEIGPCRLVVTAVFVQPWNGVGIAATIRCCWIVRRAEIGKGSYRSHQRAVLQKLSAAPNRDRFGQERVHGRTSSRGMSQWNITLRKTALYAQTGPFGGRTSAWTVTPDGLPAQTVCNSLDALLM